MSPTSGARIVTDRFDDDGAPPPDDPTLNRFTAVMEDTEVKDGDPRPFSPQLVAVIHANLEDFLNTDIAAMEPYYFEVISALLGTVVHTTRAWLAQTNAAHYVANRAGVLDAVGRTSALINQIQPSIDMLRDMDLPSELVN